MTTGAKRKVRDSIVITAEEIQRSYFSKFEARCQESRQMLASAVKFCLDMAAGEVEPYWIVFLGKSGIGKTMLTRGVVRFFRGRLSRLRDETRGQSGDYFCRRGGFKEWAEVLNEMLGFDYSGIQQLKDDWFVALDDIGAEYEKNQALSASKLYEILSKREGRWTVITANRSVQQIAQTLDVRIASRLLRHGSVVLDPQNIRDYNIGKIKQ